jgi:hypothetical protein
MHHPTLNDKIIFKVRLVSQHDFRRRVMCRLCTTSGDVICCYSMDSGDVICRHSMSSGDVIRRDSMSSGNVICRHSITSGDVIRRHSISSGDFILRGDVILSLLLLTAGLRHWHLSSHLATQEVARVAVPVIVHVQIIRALGLCLRLRKEITIRILQNVLRT